MNKPVLLAALAAALPVCALAQEAGPAHTPSPGCPAATREDLARDDLARADSALPARASTRPEPQLGTVAPNTRVPSHTDTPSMRAMRAVRAKEAGPAPDAPASTGTGCAPVASDRAQREDQKGN